MKEEEKNSKEQYADWKAPEVVHSEAEIKERVADRLAQAFSSRLCEYITSMKPEDPRMIERLEKDQSIIRHKYNLPNSNLSPSEFERALKEIANNLGVQIRPTAEYSKFFENHFLAGAVHFGREHKIAADIDRSDLEKYYKSLDVLEHELIHAVQSKQSSSMPTELKEYEAYVAGANIEYFKKHPEAVNDILFNFFIGSSVSIGYRMKSEEQGKKLLPLWDNAEYFLKLDGIDADKLNEQHKSNTTE